MRMMYIMLEFYTVNGYYFQTTDKRWYFCNRNRAEFSIQKLFIIKTLHLINIYYKIFWFAFQRESSQMQIDHI